MTRHFVVLGLGIWAGAAVAADDYSFFNRAESFSFSNSVPVKSYLEKLVGPAPAGGGNALTRNLVEAGFAFRGFEFSVFHRNDYNLDFHPETGELWSNEFGPLGGDELNLIKAGTNYGWPIITYGIEYGGDQIGEPVIQQKEGMEQPVYYWDPVLSPSGMTFYTGNNIPEWKNNLFITGLNSNHIARIIIKDNKVVGEERILGDEGQRFRDITQGKDGALYAVTDEGRLYKIDKK